jgi:hypothetical protein
VRFVVEKVALVQILSCQFTSHRLLNSHHLSFGAGTIGQIVVEVPIGFRLTPGQGKKFSKSIQSSLFISNYAVRILQP